MIESVLQNDFSLALFVIAGLVTTTLVIVRDTRQRIVLDRPSERASDSRRLP